MGFHNVNITRLIEFIEMISQRGNKSLEELIDDVFMKSFIPRTLDQVIDIERDIYDMMEDAEDANDVRNPDFFALFLLRVSPFIR